MWLIWFEKKIKCYFSQIDRTSGSIRYAYCACRLTQGVGSAADWCRIMQTTRLIKLFEVDKKISWLFNSSNSSTDNAFFDKQSVRLDTHFFVCILTLATTIGLCWMRWDKSTVFNDEKVRVQTNSETNKLEISGQMICYFSNRFIVILWKSYFMQNRQIKR